MISEAKSVHTQRWAQALAQIGFEMHVISTSVREIPDVVLHPMEIYSRNIIRQWRNLRAVQREIRKIKPDLVHLFGLFSLSSLGAMMLLRRLRPIVSVWGSDIIPTGIAEARKERFIKKYLLKRAGRIVALSKYLANETAAYSPKDAVIDVVPWGVDTKAFCPPPGKENSQELRIGFAKKLTPLSGPDVLLKAFALVLARTTLPITLWIAGNGPLEPELRLEAERLGISGHVRWVGWIDGEAGLRNFFHSIDIFVQPSRRESFGVSAAQAAACGLPVIASNFGGIPEVVIHGKTGLLVQPENPEELATAIVKLAQDRAMGSTMGDAGREWIVGSYEWNECVAKMGSIYRECAQTKSEAKSSALGMR